MLAEDLTPGQRFTVTPPDPEGLIRVCLTNDDRGIRWGFPGNNRFWSYMGSKCPVVIVAGKVE